MIALCLSHELNWGNLIKIRSCVNNLLITRSVRNKLLWVLPYANVSLRCGQILN